jgi:hypothetical protein
VSRCQQEAEPLGDRGEDEHGLHQRKRLPDTSARAAAECHAVAAADALSSPDHLARGRAFLSMPLQPEPTSHRVAGDAPLCRQSRPRLLDDLQELGVGAQTLGLSPCLQCTRGRSASDVETRL